jgi:hypothetical protein
MDYRPLSETHHHLLLLLLPLLPPWIRSFGIYETLNTAAWNVRCIGNKESELVEEIKTKGINIAVISEKKKWKTKSNQTQCYTVGFSKRHEPNQA